MSDKILVVDDEHDIADLIEVYLQNENYTVFKFYSASEALACIETNKLDLAILDIMMPEVNGFAIWASRKILCKRVFLTGKKHVKTVASPCEAG